MKRLALTLVVVVVLAFFVLGGFAMKLFFIDEKGSGPAGGSTNAVAEQPNR